MKKTIRCSLCKATGEGHSVEAKFFALAHLKKTHPVEANELSKIDEALEILKRKRRALSQKVFGDPYLLPY
jgi:hypothetical protein